jgi:hypothetical protein
VPRTDLLQGQAFAAASGAGTLTAYFYTLISSALAVSSAGADLPYVQFVQDYPISAQSIVFFDTRVESFVSTMSAVSSGVGVLFPY